MAGPIPQCLGLSIVENASLLTLCLPTTNEFDMRNARLFAAVMMLVLALTGCAKHIPQPDLAAYPRVANYYLLNQMRVSSADTLAKYDVIVVAAENQWTSAKTLKRIHKLNRKALVVA